MAETGRPTKLTPELQEQIVKTLAGGSYATTAAACAGIDASTYYRWLKRGDPNGKAKHDAPYREFRAAVEKAEAEAEVRMVTQIAVAGEKQRPAIAWLLSRRWPQRWGLGAQRKRWSFGRSKAKDGDEQAKPRLDLRRLTPKELRKIRGKLVSLDEVEAELCRQCLGEFVAQAWPVIEPGCPYVPNWHIQAIVAHLEAVSRGEIQRLIINIPPRHMKSLAVAVFWPAWVWLTHPATRFLYDSYSQQLSNRDSMRCRRLIESRGKGPRCVTVRRRAPCLSASATRACWPSSRTSPGAWPATRTPSSASRTPKAAIGSPPRWAARPPVRAAT
jgi:hypothetical protein